MFILYSNNTLVSDRAEQETQEKTIMVVSMQSTRIMIMSIDVLGINNFVLQYNPGPNIVHDDIVLICSLGHL